MRELSIKNDQTCIVTRRLESFPLTKTRVLRGGKSGSARKSTRFRTGIWGFWGVDSLSVEVGRRSTCVGGVSAIDGARAPTCRLCCTGVWNQEFAGENHPYFMPGTPPQHSIPAEERRLTQCENSPSRGPQGPLVSGQPRAAQRDLLVRGMVPEGWGSRTCASARPKSERSPLSAIGSI